jgi:hypothetical protein
VSRGVGQSGLAVHLAYRIGKRATAGDHEQPALTGNERNRLEHGVELLGVREKASAELHDRLDGPAKAGHSVGITGANRHLVDPRCV